MREATENGQNKTNSNINININDEVNWAVEECLRVVWPVWPLQNTVAVNPFWYYRDRRFDVALQEIEPAVHAPLMTSIDRYLQLLSSGEICRDVLEETLAALPESWTWVPESLEAWVQLSRVTSDEACRYFSFAEALPPEKAWSQRIIMDLGKHTAAYLDERQALARYPWQDEQFWKSWLKAQDLDTTMDRSGAVGFRAAINSLAREGALGRTPMHAIAFMAGEMGLKTREELAAYFKRLTAMVLGWATQFKYLEWQSGFGYEVPRQSSVVDLLAVRLAYDYGLYVLAKREDPSRSVSWLNSLKRAVSTRVVPESEASSHLIKMVFQLAWERSQQRSVANLLNRQKAPVVNRDMPVAQMVFCIDVRSEMLRRHIEAAEPRIQTMGFAGFFGLPFSYRRSDEDQPSQRFPVLLKPTLMLDENSDSSDFTQAFATSYFRNMRKHPLASFAYVELFGALYIEKVIRKAWLGAKRRLLKAREVPLCFSEHGARPDWGRALNGDGTALSRQELVERGAAVLRHMGLVSGFSNWVFIVGHGSETTNNAWGSALDCGACGGHAGDISARLFAQLLNDPLTREGLKKEGIEIPSTTRFLPAVHETVTDEVHLLDRESAVETLRSELEDLERILSKASEATRRERHTVVSDVLDVDAKRRASNWSELRPEWGLAGNSCFIVAPRERTRGVRFSNQSFLHDYDWRKDEANGFQTLELILTAPVVVANWINLQYYASTVAPGVYGSGNKVIHNLVNETGVVEGNGGDLKVGLAFQSIHDGQRFVHKPLRLSVYLEAPRAQIELVIQKHAVVRELVENEWLHLLHIDPETANVARRSRGGEYLPVGPVGSGPAFL